MLTPSRIADNVAQVRERIVEAATSAGRDPHAIRLVAVSKYVDVPTAAMLLAVGCIDLGEARPQELWEKSAAPELRGANWHLIGRLQRNKVRRTLPLAQLIHSVDSERLLTAINEAASELELSPRVLLEVNCSGESAKQGFAPDDLRRLASTLGRFPRVLIAGLMTMAPLEGDESAARAAFAALRKLRDDLADQVPPNVALNELSMGMSGDFEAAIGEGATIVRVGSLLFE